MIVYVVWMEDPTECFRRIMKAFLTYGSAAMEIQALETAWNEYKMNFWVEKLEVVEN